MSDPKPRATLQVGVDDEEAQEGLRNLNKGFAGWARDMGERIGSVGSGLKKLVVALSTVSLVLLVVGTAMKGLAVVSKVTAAATALLGVSFAGVTAVLGRAGTALGEWSARVGGVRGIMSTVGSGLGRLASAFMGVGLGIRLTLFAAVGLTTAFSALMAVIGAAVTGGLLVLGGAFLALTASVGGVTAAFAAGVPRAIEFDRSLRAITTIASEAELPLRRLNDISYEVAATYGGKVNDNARTLYEIISAGVTDATAATETLHAAQKLSIGGVASLSSAATGLTSVMNAYSAQGVTATRVSDAMFTAAADGATTIEQLSESLGMVAPIAASVGVSVEEMSSAVAVLTANGIKTSTAAEYLRSAITNIIKPSDDARKIAKQLGIEFNASALASQGLATFLQKVVVQSGASQEQLARLFGDVGGLTAVLALAAGNGEKLNASLERMAVNAGASDEAFGKMADTLGHQVTRWEAAKDAGLTALGQWVTESVPVRRALEAITETLGSLVTWLREDENKQAFTELFSTTLRVVAELGLALVQVVEVLDTMGQVLRVAVAPVSAVVSPVVDALRSLNLRLGEDQPDSPLLRRLSELAGRLREVADGVERVDASQLMSDPDAMSRDDQYQSQPREAPAESGAKGPPKKLTDKQRRERAERERMRQQDLLGLGEPLRDFDSLNFAMADQNAVDGRNEDLEAQRAYREELVAIQERYALRMNEIDAEVQETERRGKAGMRSYLESLSSGLEGFVDLLQGETSEGAGEALQALGSMVTDAFTNMVVNIASGSQGVLEALGGFVGGLLTQLGTMLIQLGTAALLANLLSFIPFLAPLVGPPGAGAAAGAAAIAAGAVMVGIGSAISSASSAAASVPSVPRVAGGGGGGDTSRRRPGELDAIGAMMGGPAGADRKVRPATFDDGAAVGTPRSSISSSRSEPVVYKSETHVHIGRGMLIAGSPAEAGRGIENFLGASGRLNGRRDPWGRAA